MIHGLDVAICGPPGWLLGGLSGGCLSDYLGRCLENRPGGDFWDHSAGKLRGRPPNNIV